MIDQLDDSLHLLELTAELTVVWLSNPNTKIAVDELPSAIQKIYEALVGLGDSEIAVPGPAREYLPAVSVRRSLASKDHIISLIDGKPYKMLKRHLALNGLSPAQYRERYGLKSDYPIVAENYAKKRADLARKSGLGRKITRPKDLSKPEAAPKQSDKPAKARRRKLGISTNGATDPS